MIGDIIILRSTRYVCQAWIKYKLSMHRVYIQIEQGVVLIFTLAMFLKVCNYWFGLLGSRRYGLCQDTLIWATIRAKNHEGHKEILIIILSPFSFRVLIVIVNLKSFPLKVYANLGPNVIISFCVKERGISTNI